MIPTESYFLCQKLINKKDQIVKGPAEYSQIQREWAFHPRHTPGYSPGIWSTEDGQYHTVTWLCMFTRWHSHRTLFLQPLLLLDLPSIRRFFNGFLKVSCCTLTFKNWILKTHRASVKGALNNTYVFLMSTDEKEFTVQWIFPQQAPFNRDSLKEEWKK